MNCTHENTEIRREPDSSYHYASKWCCDCGQRICFMPRPSNLNIRKANADKVEKLLAIPSLSAIDKGFCLALALATGPDGKLKVSRKEQKALDEIFAKHPQSYRLTT
jgi:hypothetical protein